ncbi:MAG: glycosyltransferase family 2 protein [Chloroflexota bacterium]|jgi:GT2 family glycosyltransferase
MSSPLVAAVILNTNRKEDTLACLESLQRSDYPNLVILVLDNACTDGSSEAVRALFPAVKIIPLIENRGYAGNNNVGIQTALELGCQWVFVLNEDIVLASDAITNLVQFGESNPKIGILGPLVFHHNEPDVIQSAGGKMTPRWQAYHIGQNEPDAGQFSIPTKMDWISGCAILVRASVIRQIGALDERFFYYWEETEWCLRTSKAGWQIWLVPQAKIWHKGVQRNYQPSPNVTYYATRNRLLALAKHHAPLAAWWDAHYTALRTWLSWSLKKKWQHKRPHRDALCQGFLDFYRQRWGMRR